MPATPHSFHLVDRILELEPGARARGTLAVPADAGEFPASLVAEAIGQLAAWVAIERADFAKRPVAARVHEVRVLGEVLPGATIELEVAIDRCTSVGVAYGGAARVAGLLIGEIEGAAGAMVPMEEFEDPEQVRMRLACLLGEGLAPRGFPPRSAFEPRVIAREQHAREAARAEIEVPTGDLYADHFPRRPVYPATLLLDAQLRVALDLVSPDGARGAPIDLSGTRVRNVKVRAFTPPGGRVELFARRVEGADDELEIAISATAAGRPVSSGTAYFPAR